MAPPISAFDDAQETSDGLNLFELTIQLSGKVLRGLDKIDKAWRNRHRDCAGDRAGGAGAGAGNLPDARHRVRR
ncbi:hypothetical protein GCM10027280_10390 [Micromonospora polyrhachis]